MTTGPLTRTDALAAVVRCLRLVVPDADPDAVDDATTFRGDLEMDSLDFLSFVEELHQSTGVRVEESDYRSLATVGACADFVSSASQGEPPSGRSR